MKVSCLQVAAATVTLAATVAAEGALRANTPRQLEEVSERRLSILCIRVIYY